VKCGTPLCEECVVKLNGRPYCSNCSDVISGTQQVKTQAVDAEPEEHEKKVRKETKLGNIGKKLRGKIPRKIPQVIRLPKELARILANTADVALIVMLSLPFAWIFRLITFYKYKDVGGLGFKISLYLAIFMVGSIYYLLFLYRFSATPGKMIFGLKVVRYGTNKKPAFGAIFWRWIGTLAASIWSYIGFVLGKELLKLIALTSEKMPPIYIYSIAVGSVLIFTILSLGLVITFVGKYKRGFHDILGGTIVVIEENVERSKEK